MTPRGRIIKQNGNRITCTGAVRFKTFTCRLNPGKLPGTGTGGIPDVFSKAPAALNTGRQGVFTGCF
jgi:hypothetical protein